MAASGSMNAAPSARFSSGAMELQECLACHARAIPIIVRLYQGTVLKGWHDVSIFIESSGGEMSEPGTKWLCEKCTRGTLQCSRCQTRFNSTEQRCPACSPREPSIH